MSAVLLFCRKAGESEKTRNHDKPTNLFHIHPIKQEPTLVYWHDQRNRRLEEHRTGTKGFAASYKMTKLVYYETFEGPIAALQRERILKKWRREKKIQLIEGSNPQWDELVVEDHHGISPPEFILSERRESKGIETRQAGRNSAKVDISQIKN